VKIARFEDGSMTGWGFVEGDDLVEMTSIEASPSAVFPLGHEGFRRLSRSGMPHRSLSELRILQPLERPSKIIGLARNYQDHGNAPGTPPQTPILFGMVPSALIGPEESIVLPAEATSVDWEVELGVVIGRRATHVSSANALDHVLGYTIVNDVSARDPEIVQGQLFRAKAFDTFKPVGPWIVTVDELGDGSDLRLQLLVNNVVMQDSTTSNLVAGVRELIELCSRTFTLEPGDLISTGTPGGTGSSRDPKVFLKDGDRVVARIERIGELANPVRSE
jgi:2-keto-4-pentenoate hydratase/2-oxohepta-3-ene-1,7-dioic acid hydratase in catechol pathway